MFSRFYRRTQTETASAEVEEVEHVDKEAERTATVGHAGEKSGSNQLQDLLMTGARLLSGLSDALGSASYAEAGGTTGSKPTDMIGRFIEQDEATGKKHLKIPLPEPEVMQSLFSGLEKLFAAFGGGKG